ncbi:hypothetical protein VOLCADRAFT_91394 [Volvox carteri f. nagariensis]|uniref:RING-type domain-containing protein n=1 Tax=Volvox carteri f. nagariensis TaxID=3068 RepID=D8TWY6_VOLCA|nr:uncharacterized protein VOLCADRAFT_91394 [Volvox carteri f. nagariensis]EFJ47918.1 hypothetical protein VOLCADRAFT_91394 [Volvox carteri f. nagariensis]|eukprot:XP_002951024.1 hypothetical protein VOLCADRAFT_91394 [Volvox carteri f. nagariensis]
MRVLLLVRLPASLSTTGYESKAWIRELEAPPMPASKRRRPWSSSWGEQERWASSSISSSRVMQLLLRDLDELGWDSLEELDQVGPVNARCAQPSKGSERLKTQKAPYFGQFRSKAQDSKSPISVNFGQRLKTQKAPYFGQFRSKAQDSKSPISVNFGQRLKTQKAPYFGPVKGSRLKKPPISVNFGQRLKTQKALFRSISVKGSRLKKPYFGQFRSKAQDSKSPISVNFGQRLKTQKALFRSISVKGSRLKKPPISVFGQRLKTQKAPYFGQFRSKAQDSKSPISVNFGQRLKTQKALFRSISVKGSRLKKPPISVNFGQRLKTQKAPYFGQFRSKAQDSKPPISVNFGQRLKTQKALFRSISVKGSRLKKPPISVNFGQRLKTQKAPYFGQFRSKAQDSKPPISVNFGQRLKTQKAPYFGQFRICTAAAVAVAAAMAGGQRPREHLRALPGHLPSSNTGNINTTTIISTTINSSISTSRQGDAVSAHQPLWRCLDLLDRRTRVLDPPPSVSASRRHLGGPTRRVALGSTAVSLQLRLDPSDPLGPPPPGGVAFLGPPEAAAQLREGFFGRLHLWDWNSDIVENLEMLLGQPLPAPQGTRGGGDPWKEVEEDECEGEDSAPQQRMAECPICMMHLLPVGDDDDGEDEEAMTENTDGDDADAFYLHGRGAGRGGGAAAGGGRGGAAGSGGGAGAGAGALRGLVPDVVCPTPACGLTFHTPCLAEWLRSLHDTRVSFSKLFGRCPFCSNPITHSRITSIEHPPIQKPDKSIDSASLLFVPVLIRRMASSKTDAGMSTVQSSMCSNVACGDR